MRLKLVSVFLLVFVIGFVSASFSVNDSYLQESYGVEESVSGWVEISFSNQSLNESITDRFGNSAELSELLDINSEYNYTEINETQKINSESQRLYLDNLSFNVPSSIFQSNYWINLGNETIVSENISVTDIKSAVVEKLEREKEKLHNLTLDLETYPLFLRSSISGKLNIPDIEENISVIESGINGSVSQQGYQSALNGLNSLKIPFQVYDGESGYDISLVISKDRINLDLISTITGENYDSSRESDYKDAILVWNIENLNPRITFRSIDALYEDSSESVINYFELSVPQRPSESTYLFIESEDIKFEKNYGQIVQGDYSYIDLNKVTGNVVFVLSEEADFSDLPIFISPEISELVLSEENPSIIDSDKESKVSKWVLFSLVVIFLLVLFIVGYILLRNWYDKKYESYLFRNRNDLYNLIVYINTSKKRGMKKKEIGQKLRNASWSREQVRYIMRKYAGKETGMWNPFDRNKGTQPKNTVRAHKI